MRPVCGAHTTRLAPRDTALSLPPPLLSYRPWSMLLPPAGGLVGAWVPLLLAAAAAAAGVRSCGGRKSRPGCHPAAGLRSAAGLRARTAKLVEASLPGREGRGKGVGEGVVGTPVPLVTQAMLSYTGEGGRGLGRNPVAAGRVLDVCAEMSRGTVVRGRQARCKATNVLLLAQGMPYTPALRFGHGNNACVSPEISYSHTLYFGNNIVV